MKTTLLILIASLASLAPVHADQNVMLNARRHASNALAALKNNATADKGGHRVAAMKHLSSAIAEIDAGIAFDKSTVTKNEGKKGKKN